MEDLAPDITRQRLLLEGFFDADVGEAEIGAYFAHITQALALRTYGQPIIYAPGRRRPRREPGLRRASAAHRFAASRCTSGARAGSSPS